MTDTWNGKRIDVKTSNRRKRKNGKIQYSFSTKNPDCDYYLLIVLDDENYPVKILLVPRTAVKGVTVAFTYGTKSKWDKYVMEVDKDELEEAVRYAKEIG